MISQLKQAIKVTEYGCHKSGLDISYSINGNFHFLMPDAEASADLLKQIGAIESYSGNGNEVMVKVMFEHEITGKEALTEMSWRDFIVGFELSQSDAIWICAIVEDKKITDRLLAQVLGIPSLIQSIAN